MNKLINRLIKFKLIMMRLTSAICIAFLLLASTTHLFGQTTFTGANSNDFFDSGNWDNGLPCQSVFFFPKEGSDNTCENNAIIPIGMYAVVSADMYIENFNIFNYGTIENNAELTFTGYFGDGNFYNYGTFENNGLTSGDFEGGLSGNSGTVNNSGTINVVISLGINNNGTINNLSGGTINFLQGWNSNSGTINNLSGGTIFNDTALENNGDIYSCYGIYSGDLPVGNPIITQEECGVCGDIAGCIDAGACNYNPAADCDDGSCLLPDGCMNISACNYDPTASCDDGSCLLPDGCMNIFACNYDSIAVCDDGSCDYSSCAGCKAENACNYDATATIHDDNCDYTSCAGCTYPEAPEYDSTATIDDGSCSIDVCKGDFTGDGFVNVDDLGAFLGAFGNSCE